MKLDLANFPEHNWIIKKDTSHKNETGVIKWSKLKCEECGTILDCFYDDFNSNFDGIVKNTIDVYYNGKLNRSICYSPEDVHIIKEKIYSCSELIIKNIVE